MEKITLNNINRGMVGQLFDRELQEVLENIRDTRTSPTAARTITLKIKIKPEQDRHATDIEVSADCSLAPRQGSKGMMFLSFDGEEVKATTTDPRQMNLADQLKEKIANNE